MHKNEEFLYLNLLIFNGINIKVKSLYLPMAT